MIKKYPLISFTVFAYGITWLSMLPLIATGIKETEFLLSIGLFGPALSAYIVTRVNNSAEKRERKNKSFWWFFFGTLILGTLVWSFESNLRLQMPISTALALFWIPSLILAWMIANTWNRRPSIKMFFRDLLFPKGPPWVFVFCLLYFPVSHYLFTYIAGTEHNLWPKAQTGFAYVGIWLLVSIKILFFTGGVNEETGWRGFLLKGVLDKFNPIVATFIVWKYGQFGISPSN